MGRISLRAVFLVNAPQSRQDFAHLWRLIGQYWNSALFGSDPSPCSEKRHQFVPSGGCDQRTFQRKLVGQMREKAEKFANNHGPTLHAILIIVRMN
jgi:hypothetical protein